MFMRILLARAVVSSIIANVTDAEPEGNIPVTASLDAPAHAHLAARSGSADGMTGRPFAPWALTAVVLAGQAMASLDSAIVNVAGPAMQRDLRLSGPALQLAVYSYLLVYAVALVAGARLPPPGVRVGGVLA